MRANDSQPADAEALPPPLPPSWHPRALHIAATLSYCALVPVVAAYLNHILPVENPLVIIASTLVIAGAFSPLLIPVRRHRRPSRTAPEGVARPWAAVGSLLGAIVLAVLLYVVLSIGGRWAVHLLGHPEAAPTVIVLATLVALVGSAALFTRMYSAFRRP